MDRRIYDTLLFRGCDQTVVDGIGNFQQVGVLHGYSHGLAGAGDVAFAVRCMFCVKEVSMPG